MPGHLPEPGRKEIFSTLVDAQEHEMPVAKSQLCASLYLEASGR
jgi:hypothetical protein